MIDRCTNPKFKQWKDCGGRGIKVCAAWEAFPQFLADIGPKPSPDMTIERRDNDGNYEPGNCHWATRLEQCRNSRRNKFITINGRRQTQSAWIVETGICPSTFYKRVKRGIKPELALTMGRM